MTLIDESEIDYPRIVTVSRLPVEFGESGEFEGEPTVVIPSMIADIQLSLKIRELRSEDRTGSSENAAWLMFCIPPAPLREGDIVTDGDRSFIVDSVGDWGSHVECAMRKR